MQLRPLLVFMWKGIFFIIFSMKKIVNPFTAASPEEYNCFGCSPHNTSGLKLEFWEDGDTVLTKYNPHRNLMGFSNVLHGGIQATILDELGGWVVLLKCETAGVTSQLNVKYLKPLYISKGEIQAKAKLILFEDKIAVISAEIFDGEDGMCASAEIHYFCYPQAIARRKLGYPESVEAFYNPLRK